MKLSINKITILFVLIISILTLFVRLNTQTGYIINNSFKQRNFTYANDFKLCINNTSITKNEDIQYTEILYNILQNSYNINFLTEKEEVILYSPYYVIHFFYGLEGKLKLNQINITTANKKYCEN